MENHKISISLMIDSDLQSLKENLQDNFDDFWTYTTLENEFKNPSTTYVVAKEDDSIVGFAGILTVLDEADVMNIVVRKDKRRLGIGSLLLSELINISKSKKMKTLTLEVNEHNIPAIDLYKKFNFEQVGIRKKYYHNTDSAILMTLYF